jgi:glucose-1-phosphate thymidylyltransferase
LIQFVEHVILNLSTARKTAARNLMASHDSGAQAPDIIGVIPMAGRATRLPGLSRSKEILPARFRTRAHDSGGQPRVVCEYLLEKMHVAGVTRAYVVLRDGKWDIPAYLGDGSMAGLRLAYLMMDLPYGTPYSVDQAFPFMQHANVTFGFPDMVLGPGNMFRILLEYQRTNHADIVIGLFPADRPNKVDMVELCSNGKVKRVVIKPQYTDLQTTWGVAVWTPVFTRFMHDFLASHQQHADSEPELYMGHVVQAGIDNGLSVYGTPVSKLPFIDIGTPDDLEWAITPHGE